SLGGGVRRVIQVAHRAAAVRSWIQGEPADGREPRGIFRDIRKGFLVHGLLRHGSRLRAQGFAMSMLLAVTCVAASAETVDRVLAVVAGQLITLSDVNAVRDL